jgi:hypothetical protein
VEFAGEAGGHLAFDLRAVVLDRQKPKRVKPAQKIPAATHARRESTAPGPDPPGSSR